MSSWWRRDVLIIGLLALGMGVFAASLIQNPGYTDAYYYFNAGQRLIQGKGLTDAAVFTYIGLDRLPAGLPIPSHLYWMPLPSLVAALGMAIGGPNFDAAQIGFVALYVVMAILGYVIGITLHNDPKGARRTGWFAALLTLLSGFFMPYWFTTATFGPFGVSGALCLIGIGFGRKTDKAIWYVLAGVCAGVAHLSRADGLLFVFVILIVALWPRNRRALSHAGIGLLAYLIVMTPWFIRNWNAIGLPLPAGGIETAWMRSYDEIANYPPGASLDRFLSWGLGNILASRWEAFAINMQRFVAEEGMIVLAPFMLIGLWRRRFDPFLAGFLLYVIGLHLAMTLGFSFPGPRGGLFHSASALVPFWGALSLLGLNEVIGWIARRRRWRVGEAQTVFAIAILIWAVCLSLATLAGKASGWNSPNPALISLDLPSDSVVAINDPAAYCYFTGRSAVVLPNAGPEVLPDLARRYGLTHIALDQNRTAPMAELYEGKNVPSFLEQIAFDGNMRVYRLK